MNIFAVLTYLIPLTLLHATLEDNNVQYCPDRINYTSSGNIVYLTVRRPTPGLKVASSRRDDYIFNVSLLFIGSQNMSEISRGK
jgi:hypothetical protein